MQELQIINTLDKFFHNSPGVERYLGTPHVTGYIKENPLLIYLPYASISIVDIFTFSLIL